MKYKVGNDVWGRDWVIIDIKTNRDLINYMETYNYVEPVLNLDELDDEEDDWDDEDEAGDYD